MPSNPETTEDRLQTRETMLLGLLRDRIAARAREICRLADGSPCAGPDTDCDPSNCHAMQRADMECRKS